MRKRKENPSLSWTLIILEVRMEVFISLYSQVTGFCQKITAECEILH